MSRKPISREKLDEFISMSAEFSLLMEAPLTRNKSKDQSILLRRIELVCSFLKDADKHDVISLKLLSVRHFVKDKGARIKLTKNGDRFLPAESFTNRPFVPCLSNPQKYFSDAARHVGIMARLIKNEADRPQTSERVSNPYKEFVHDWKPAKLAA